MWILVMANTRKHGSEAYAKSPQVSQDLCLLMLKDLDGNFVEIVGANTEALDRKASEK